QIGPQAERNQNKKGFRLPKPRQKPVKQITVQQRAQKPQVVGKGRTVPEKQLSKGLQRKHVSCRFQGQASLSVQHDKPPQKIYGAGPKIHPQSASESAPEHSRLLSPGKISAYHEKQRNRKSCQSFDEFPRLSGKTAVNPYDKKCRNALPHIQAVIFHFS